MGTAHRAYAAAMAEDGALTEVEFECLAAALREIDTKKAAISDDAVHYAPGDSPLYGEDVVGALCTYDPAAVAGCIPSLELVAEDLAESKASAKRTNCGGGIVYYQRVDVRRSIRPGGPLYLRLLHNQPTGECI